MKATHLYHVYSELVQLNRAHLLILPPYHSSPPRPVELKTFHQKAHVVDVARVEYLSEEWTSYLIVS